MAWRRCVLSWPGPEAPPPTLGRVCSLELASLWTGGRWVQQMVELGTVLLEGQ
jgi:hypothetical protein